MKDIAFLLEIQKLAVEMDNLVEKYNMRDRFVSVLVSGFLEVDEFGEMKMNAIYSYHIDSFFELEEIISFVSTTYQYESPYTIEDYENDIDDLLGDLGIELED